MHTPDEARALYMEHVPEQVRARVDSMLDAWKHDGHDPTAAVMVRDWLQAAYHTTNENGG